ncbi:GDP-mannose 4,6-dehydratase [Butyrivibrio sp. NC3005]|uniref:GDP-mannose 4,6-dehydratase n=1 Tax=Butyrivibrio sp. NC3005 TaxID=1280685 RepID=UPI00041A9245|nr:GDP-mannose 4,6-dehydratase [Butyrivibrio sp. NC3005]
MEKIDNTKIYFVTGAAGFIGFYLSKKLLENGCFVVGLDNVNDYYDVSLKEQRLCILEQTSSVYKTADLLENDNKALSELFNLDDIKNDNRKGQFIFIKGDLSNRNTLKSIFASFHPDYVINLAAQAGVRYSIDHPDSYIESNIIGFYNILECCRQYKVEHLVFASSSSVYGGNTKVPFSTDDKVDEPVSLYAATKKSDELMAHAYSKLYDIPATGLRFFTVYGPMGRPDMAYYKFTDKIVNGQTIQIYNNGDMRRDFTYIDDIIKGICNVIFHPPIDNGKGARYKIYNIGNNHPEPLMDMVRLLEKYLKIEAKKEFLPMQPGDVYQTYADTSDLEKNFGFKPSTSLEEGLRKFVDWYFEYKNL